MKQVKFWLPCFCQNLYKLEFSLGTGYNPTLGRIIGGKDVTNNIPWQVSIQQYVQKENRWEHFCGGTILNQYTILSAAHCFSDTYHHPEVEEKKRLRFKPVASLRIVAGSPFVHSFDDGTVANLQV